MEPDVKLLFGVLGGGSISGESGKRIAEELSNIVKEINDKGILNLKVKVDLDDDSATTLQKGIQDAFDKLNSNKKGFVVNLTKIDTKSAVAGLKKDIQAVLNSLSIRSGMEISMKTDIGDIASNIKKETKEIKSDFDEAANRAAKFKAQMDSLSDQNSGLRQNVKSSTKAAAGLGLQDDVDALNERYRRFAELFELIKNKQILLTEDQIDVINDERYAIEEQSRSVQEAAKAAIQAKQEQKDVAKDAADEEKKAAADRERNAKKEQTDLQKILRLYDQTVKYKNNNTKIEGTSFGNRLESIITTLEQVKSGAIDISKVDISDLTKQFTQLKGDVDAAGLSGKSLLTIIKEGYKKYGGWSFITKTMSAAWRSVQKMITAVKDIDTAMTELKKVTNETAQAYDNFLHSATLRARQLGATVSDTVSSTADFARLGYSLEQASSLADAAIIYKNVGDGIEDIGDASESIISTIKAFEKFGITAENAMLVVDKFNEVGNNFAISSKGVGDALLNSAAALAAAGNDLDKTIAMVTAANEVIQDPEHVGTTLKTVSMFLRAAKTEAEEAGESTEGMANSISELRAELLALTGGKVDIQIDNDSFKDTYTILRELSGEWENLTDVTRANILEMVGGKRNANVVAALIENFATAEEVLQKSADAAGSATAENEKFLDSINGRIAQFKASFETLAQTVVDSDLVKWVVDGGTLALDILTKIVDTVGAIPALATAAGIALSSMNVTSPLSPLKYNPTENNIVNNFGFSKINKEDVAAIDAYRIAMKGLAENSDEAREAFDNTMSSASNLAKQFVKNNELTDLSKLSFDDLSNALNVYKAKAIAAKVATSIFNSVLSTLVGIAVNFAIKQFTDLIQRNKELSEATLEAAENYNTAKDSLVGYVSKISELKEQLSSDALSHEEAYAARKQLLEIQNSIIKAYGGEANSLDLLAMSAEDATNAINGIVAAEASNNLSKNSENIKNAIKHVEKIDDYLSGYQNVVIDAFNPKMLADIENTFAKYGDILRKTTNDAGAATYFWNLNTDALSAKEIINSLAKDIRALDDEWSKYGKSVDDIFYGKNSFSNIFSDALTNIDNYLEKNDYGKVYEQAIQWKIADDASYDEVMRNIISLEEEYNDVLAKTYSSEFERASAIEQVIAKYYELKEILGADGFFGEDDYGVQKYFENMLSGFEVNIQRHEARSALKGVFDSYLSAKKLIKEFDEEDVIDGNTYSDTAEATEQLRKAREKFIETARLAGLTESQIATALKDSELALDSLGDSANGVEYDILTLNEALTSLSTMQGEVDKLSEALGEFYENKEISVETAAGLTETFGNLQGFDDFIAVLTDESSTLADVQTALDTLGAEYVESTGILEKLTDENKELVKTYLKKIGVTNAEEIVERKLAKSKYDAIIAANGLTDATWDEIEAFLINAGASDAVMEHMDNLRKSEYDLQVQSIKFAEANNAVFESLLKAAAAADVNAVATGNLLKAQKLLRDYEEGLVDTDVFEKEMALLQEGALTGIGDYKLEFVVDFNVDMPKDLKDKAEDAFEKLQKEFSKIIANYEHNIFLGEKDGADYTAIIAIYKEMQDAVHAQAEKYRAMGLSENSEYIQELQKQWWDYQDKIAQLRQDHFDDYLTDKKFSIEVMQNDDVDSNEIIASWKEIVRSINTEIKYYTDLGYDYTSDVIQNLINEAWSAKEEIENAIQAVVDKANESLDGFQDAYSTITDAAKEYASTGYLSADSLQSLLDLGPKYLSFLEDENGQLVLNEEALQNVIAAKTEEMAVETAMAFSKRVLIAAENDDIKALEELTQVNITATNSTWDMAYATLGLAKAIGTAKGHSSAYYDDAIREVRNIQALAKTTVSSIQEYYKTLNEGYVSQADGLQTILEMTQEMIQWEQEQKVQALEDEKDAISDIVEKQKESLKITKEQNDHEASLAEKLKKIARLRDEIDILSLDNSREAQAEKIAKQEEYDELIKEYADEQAEYSITIQTETLEKTEDALLESKDKEIQAAENTLNSTEKLYQEAIKRIETDWDTLYEDLLKWNYEYGSTLEKDLVNAWDSAAEAVQRYGSFVAALEGVQSHTNLGSSYIGNAGVTTGSEMTDEMSAIYNRMKQNSFDWFLSGDKSKQADLSSENKSLAKEWEALTGQALTSKDFSWYTSDGSLFYSLDKNDVAEAVVSIMESNAAEWKVADKQGNSTKKDSLAATNRQLAADLAYYLGRNIENIGGTWYIDGQPLFDVYHTGGIVGGKGTLKQNEVMAVLEEGEIVLDEGKEKVLYRFVDFAQMMSEKLGRAFDNVSFKNAFSGQNRMPALVGNAIPETTNNMNFNPIVNVNIQHNGSLDDGDAKRFGSIAANSVLSELTDAFSRRGISNVGSAFLK